MQRVCGVLRGAAKSSVCTRGTDGEGMRCCALCPPHSTAQAAACRFVKESGAAGSLELDAMAQHALRTPSPLLPHLRGAVRGGAWPWPWAAHPREAIDTGRRLAAKLLCTFLPLTPFTHPEANPEAIYMHHRLHLRAIASASQSFPPQR